MIAADLEKNLQAVRADAKERGLSQMMVEHLLLILLEDNPSVRQHAKRYKPDVAGLSRSLSNYLEMYATTNLRNYHPIAPSPVFERVLRRAVKMAGGEATDGIHFIAAIFNERDSFAAYNLTKYGFEQLHIRGQMASYGKGAVEISPAGLASETSAATLPNLVAQAAAGRVAEPVCCEQPLARLVQILERKYKNNPLIIGEAGVGKTALVHGLAHRIASGEVPASLQNAQIVPVLVSDLVAGTKYRGDFEQRIRALVDKCQAHGNSIVFIDEIHTLVGSGATVNSSDAANLFKPILLEKGIRYIGTTTFAEYRRHIEKDPALARRFGRLEMPEPRGDTLHAILSAVAQQLSDFHQVALAEGCIAAAVEYADYYLPNRHFPDKAIDILDDCAAQHKTLAAAADDPLTPDDIAEAARRSAGLPAKRRADASLAQLHAQLSDAVIAQDAAARALSGAVLRGKLQYHHDSKTLGNYLFSGPTGVGKTEMAQQLAHLLQVPLLRYDMTEYTSAHTLARLIGSPPGYIGYERGGQLVEDVFCYPNAVVLFDEAEKAHPEVLNILLQIMDSGQLTDNCGRAVSFKNAILILTSNLGTRAMEEAPAGFARQAGDEALWEETIQRFFPPEFRNRLDAVIYFKPLAAAAIRQILQKHLDQLQAMLWEKKHIRIRIAPALKARLQTASFSPTMGARPLARQLRQLVLEPLAFAEANGNLPPHYRYTLDLAAASNTPAQQAEQGAEQAQVQVTRNAAIRPPRTAPRPVPRRRAKVLP